VRDVFQQVHARAVDTRKGDQCASRVVEATRAEPESGEVLVEAVVVEVHGPRLSHALGAPRSRLREPLWTGWHDQIIWKPLVAEFFAPPDARPRGVVPMALNLAPWGISILASDAGGVPAGQSGNELRPVGHPLPRGLQ